MVRRHFVLFMLKHVDTFEIYQLDDWIGVHLSGITLASVLSPAASDGLLWHAMAADFDS